MLHVRRTGLVGSCALDPPSLDGGWCQQDVHVLAATALYRFRAQKTPAGYMFGRDGTDIRTISRTSEIQGGAASPRPAARVVTAAGHLVVTTKRSNEREQFCETEGRRCTGTAVAVSGCVHVSNTCVLLRRELLTAILRGKKSPVTKEKTISTSPCLRLGLLIARNLVSSNLRTCQERNVDGDSAPNKNPPVTEKTMSTSPRRGSDIRGGD